MSTNLDVNGNGAAAATSSDPADDQMEDDDEMEADSQEPAAPNRPESPAAHNEDDKDQVEKTTVAVKIEEEDESVVAVVVPRVQESAVQLRTADQPRPKSRKPLPGLLKIGHERSTAPASVTQGFKQVKYTVCTTCTMYFRQHVL